jgi:hypothetical protein
LTNVVQTVPRNYRLRFTTAAAPTAQDQFAQYVRWVFPADAARPVYRNQSLTLRFSVPYAFELYGGFAGALLTPEGTEIPLSRQAMVTRGFTWGAAWGASADLASQYVHLDPAGLLRPSTRYDFVLRPARGAPKPPECPVNPKCEPVGRPGSYDLVPEAVRSKGAGDWLPSVARLAGNNLFCRLQCPGSSTADPQPGAKDAPIVFRSWFVTSRYRSFTEMLGDRRYYLLVDAQQGAEADDLDLDAFPMTPLGPSGVLSSAGAASALPSATRTALADRSPLDLTALGLPALGAHQGDLISVQGPVAAAPALDGARQRITFDTPEPIDWAHAAARVCLDAACTAPRAVVRESGDGDTHHVLRVEGAALGSGTFTLRLSASGMALDSPGMQGRCTQWPARPACDPAYLPAPGPEAPVHYEFGSTVGWTGGPMGLPLMLENVPFEDVSLPLS